MLARGRRKIRIFRKLWKADHRRPQAQRRRASSAKGVTRMGKLQGKVAVVTGGTTGIGFATTKRFVDEGAYVFITGRRQKELDEAVKAIGGNVASVRGDVSKLPDLDRLYETVKAKGKIDVLVANAGIGSVASAKAQLPSVPTARPRPRFEFCTN